MTVSIHDSAIVDHGATIGDGTRIWHFTHICGGARIGRDCSLGQNVFIGNDVRIGNNVKIQNNVSVYDAVTLEDDVFCGPSMVFTNVYNPRSAVARKNEYRPTLVRRGASIGANATVVCGTTIGQYAFIAAGAVVNHDVPDFAMMAGVPARRIGWMSRHGERLPLPADGNGEAVCPHTGERYVLENGVCRLQERSPVVTSEERAPAEKIDFCDLKSQYRALSDGIGARIRTVLQHGQYIMGPEVHELEERLAAYTGASHCITVASGTEALLISLMACGIGAGDEVITTPFSFIATAEAIVLAGATPVFVDIDPATCNINAALIEERITSRTRAIMPVSLYGQPSDMDEINAIARKYRLIVIEDGAQSFGAIYRGRRSCNLSSIGCTSFFPSKPLGCYGDGGAIFTSDASLAQEMREIRVHGQAKRYVHTRLGVGGRMDTLQCAIVLAKLERFDWELEQRQQIGQRYNMLLDGYVDTVKQRADRTSVFAQYTIRVSDRQSILESLQELQIPTAVHYPLPISRQPAYARYAADAHMPVADAMSQSVLSLPMSADLNPILQDRIVRAVMLATAQKDTMTGEGSLACAG